MDRQELIDGINYVPDKYIMYEMKIRGQNTARSTLHSRKKRLLHIFEQETEGAMSEMIFHLPLAEDLKECADFLNEVELEMTVNLEANAVVAEFQLLYLKERVERLPTSPSEKLYTLRLSLLTKIEELEKHFGNVSVAIGQNEQVGAPPVKNLNDFYTRLNSLTMNSAVLNQTSRHSSTGRSQIGQQTNSVTFDQGGRTNSPDGAYAPAYASQRTPSPTQVSQQNTRNVSNLNNTRFTLNASSAPQSYNARGQIWKWNLKFSGDKDEMTANEFIQKVNDLSISRGVSDVQVLDGIPELLTGSAEKWYRTTKRNKPFENFADFAVRFIDDFEPIYKVDTRLEMLKKRLQRPDERVVPYFAHMENEFFSIANTPHAQEQIRIIRKNLLPHFISHLACQQFDSVEELKKACKLIETGQDMIKVQNVSRGNCLIPSTAHNFNAGNPQSNVTTQNAIQRQPSNQYRNNNTNFAAQNKQHQFTNQPVTQFPMQQSFPNQMPSNANNYRNNSHVNSNNASTGYAFPSQNNGGPQQQGTTAQTSYNYVQNRGVANQQQGPIQQSQQYVPRNQNTVSFRNQNQGVQTQASQLPGGPNQYRPQQQYLNQNRQTNRYSQGFQNFTEDLRNDNGQNRSFAQANQNRQNNDAPNNSTKVACTADIPMTTSVQNILDDETIIPVRNDDNFESHLVSTVQDLDSSADGAYDGADLSGN